MTGAATELDHSGLSPKYISGAPRYDILFSFVTLVADEAKYRRLIASLHAKGFHAGNSELIALDNRQRNNFDGYTYLRRGALEARGRYIVLTHDDVEFLHDDASVLEAELEKLSRRDPNWMVAGNAGVPPSERIVRHIDDPHGLDRIDHAREVESVDENFMVVRREALVLGSIDLSGFHMYGPDLCLQAELAGGKSYVIPFLLKHHSGGKQSEAYFDGLSRFQAKYEKLFSGRVYGACTGTIFFGGEPLKHRLNVLAARIQRKLRSKLSFL